jgi:hypothetical protein
MTRNRRLARHVAGVGMGELRRQVEYKTDWSGVRLHIAGRWYPVPRRVRVVVWLKPSSACPNVHSAAMSAPSCSIATGTLPVTSPHPSATSSQTCGATVNEPDGNPHRPTPCGQYRHGKTHDVNAAPQGDGCPNRANSYPLNSSSGNGQHQTGFFRWRSAFRSTRPRAGIAERVLACARSAGVSAGQSATPNPPHQS